MAPLLHFDLLDQRQRQQLLQQAQALARTQAFQHAHAPPPQQPPRLAYSRVSASRPSQQQLLHARQATVTTTAAAGSHHLSGGAIAGIVIGCIVGVLLLAWILRLCLNPPPAWRQAWVRDDVETATKSRHYKSGSYSHNTSKNNSTSTSNSNNNGKNNSNSKNNSNTTNTNTTNTNTNKDHNVHRDQHRHRSPARRHHRHHSDPGDRVGKHNNTANTHRHTRSDARRPEIEIIQKPTPVVVRRRSTSRRRTTFGKATYAPAPRPSSSSSSSQSPPPPLSGRRSTAVRASHGERKADDGPSETVERGRKPRRFYETYSGRA